MIWLPTLLITKKLNSIVTELFIGGRKLNLSLFLSHNHILRFQKLLDWIIITFLSQKFQKEGTSTNCLSHSSDISSKDSINICKKCPATPYSFLVNDATLASDNPLKPEAIESESNNKRSISKEIYDKILDERINEILQMSR